MKEQEHVPILPSLERVPMELKAYAQWVNWRLVNGRKVPVNPATLGNAGVGWPNTWSSFEHVCAVYGSYRDANIRGVGFVLTENDPYTCVDLDGCVGERGQVSSQTQAVLDLLAGRVELSPSGTGLHIWVRSAQSFNRRTQGIEVYSHARWMSVTGRSHPQAPVEIPERTAELEELVRHYFPQSEVQPVFAAPAMPLADEEIWARLFHAKNGVFFERLFQGDTSVCYHDHSRAVILLANQLAAMIDLDAARIKQLLYQTGLVNAKWETRRGQSTWIDYQIQDAIRYVAGRKR
jgi:putative DNA primase/helicase